jgi:hypothetical protein
LALEAEIAVLIASSTTLWSKDVKKQAYGQIDASF